MKKLLILAVTLLITSGAVAQIQWGVKGGMNFANVTNADGKFKPSVHVGVLAEFKLGSIISFQPELLYSRQGSYNKDDGIKMWLRMNYINFPMMVKLYATEKLSIDIGPQFGFMLNSKFKAKGNGFSMTVDLDKLSELIELGGEYVDIEQNKFDVSLAMGMSYKLTDNFDLFGRYNLGMSKVFSDSDKNKNSVIQLGLGYRF